MHNTIDSGSIKIKYFEPVQYIDQSCQYCQYTISNIYQYYWPCMDRFRSLHRTTFELLNANSLCCTRTCDEDNTCGCAVPTQIHYKIHKIQNVTCLCRRSASEDLFDVFHANKIFHSHVRWYWMLCISCWTHQSEID
jgi:hypothetical protein